jgi:serine/threonine protein kinase
MASRQEQGPTTDVTGSPVSRSRGARPGEVLGERYEILERIGKDAFATNHRAQDQETEKPCVVRLIDPSLLGKTPPRAIADALSEAIGVGNRFLPALLDADVDEKGRLYVVESPPSGASLREVLSSRRARGDALSPKEALPVISSLAAAVEAIPEPLHHGDVRLDRIWLGEAGLTLTFPFVVAKLPPISVATAAQGDPVLSRTMAPELSRGVSTSAADRFGVACVAYECLTGTLPKPGEPAPERLRSIADALDSLLVKDHEKRPKSLDPLVEAIAKVADLPIPNVDPGAYDGAKKASGNPTSGLLLPPDEVVEPTPMGAPTRNRRALMMDTIEETSLDLVESTAKVPPMSADAAAEALGQPAKSRGSDDDYDDLALTDKARPLARTGSDEHTHPRARKEDLKRTREEAKPKRKGRLPEGAAEGGTQEIDAEDILDDEPTDATRKKGQLPEGAAEGGTQEILAEDLEELPSGKTTPRGETPGTSARSPRDDEPKKRRKKSGEGTQQVLAEDILEVVDAEDEAPKPAAEGTQQVRAEDIIEARSADRDGDGDDRVAPHLLAAALSDGSEKKSGSADAPKRERKVSVPDIDPRLMRAALGVEMDADEDDDEEVEAAAPKKRLPPAPAKKEAAPKPVAPPPGRLPPAPKASKPSPRAAPMAASKPAPAPAPAPKPAAPASAASKSTPPFEKRKDPTPKVVLTGEYDADEESSIDGTSVAPYAAPLAARQSAMGKWILIGAVVLATIIILGGVLIASQRRAEAERERRLQQRFLELQQESGTNEE